MTGKNWKRLQQVFANFINKVKFQVDENGKYLYDFQSMIVNIIHQVCI